MLYRLRNEVQHRETNAVFCSIKPTKRLFLQGGRVALHPDRIVVGLGCVQQLGVAFGRDVTLVPID